MMLKEAISRRYPILSGCIIVCIIFFIFLTSLSFAATVNLGPIGDVTTWPDTPYRWMDIADNEYSVSYQTSFDYGQPNVSLTYIEISNTFSGTLTATGLKPNFAYQMKLVGKPEIEWGIDGDDISNEQIGYAGRWWRKQGGSGPGNTDDTDYNAHKDDPDYIFEGYLLFDFFATDEQGNATVDFAADSSFHVLWATHGSTGDGDGHRDPVKHDSAVRDYNFTASSTTNPTAYDTAYGDADVGIYGQWENGRALPGELVLPNGEYNCQFILTEESFHQSGLGGYWAGAMGYNDVQFTLVPIPSAVWLLGTGIIGLVCIRRKYRR